MTVNIIKNSDDSYSVIKHNNRTSINCKHFKNKNDAINQAIIQAKREGNKKVVIN